MESEVFITLLTRALSRASPVVPTPSNPTCFGPILILSFRSHVHLIAFFRSSFFFRVAFFVFHNEGSSPRGSWPERQADSYFPTTRLTSRLRPLYAFLVAVRGVRAPNVPRCEFHSKRV
jgi:hypothetical protein